MIRRCEICGKRIRLFRRIKTNGKWRGALKIFSDKRHSLCLRHHNALWQSLRHGFFITILNMKFSELKVYLAENGFLPDEIGFEKTIVERYRCPRCREPLQYRGYSDTDITLAYGVCEPCDYAKRFFDRPPLIAAGRKRFSKAASIL